MGPSAGAPPLPHANSRCRRPHMGPSAAAPQDPTTSHPCVGVLRGSPPLPPPPRTGHLPLPHRPPLLAFHGVKSATRAFPPGLN
ncbi:hypothetical protein GUJ93_ZPchr0013g36075 [Zizania palustris]|uniref:Uncharacterized protein n=1 Tax=Zizania palustris TaxID=103762 RepID=A0A8J5WSU8_ZIZPA|nr:hypothetical protein GUJ93_ZPchr0013g36075 [Zizania palustris]